MHDEPVSKTRRKREMHELQALGAALVELGDAQLDALELPDALAAAVRAAKRIKSHEASAARCNTSAA